MQDELISIIVPVSESEEHLDRCIESLVNQSYENLEIILVDNGSCDTSPMICDSWTQKDIRVKVIHNKKGSIASAKNAGLDYANGEYISFVNADNFVDKDYIYILLKNLEETHSDISVCSLCRYFEVNGEMIEEGTDKKVETKSNKKVVANLDENLEEEIILDDEGKEDTEDDDNFDSEEDDEDNNLNDFYASSYDDDNDNDNDDSGEEPFIIENEKESEDNAFSIETQNIKLLEKKKSRSRIVFFEGEDIFDYFFSTTEKVKTALFAKLFRKKIFKKLRFKEDRIYEDEFIAHKIYLECKKLVRTSSQLYYYNVTKSPFKNSPKFLLKDLDKYYALEERYNYFKTTKWQAQALSQMLVQIENIYCFACAGKADSNTLKFLKHKFKLYYSLNKKHKSRDRFFRHCPTLYYYLKRLTTNKMLI